MSAVRTLTTETTPDSTGAGREDRPHTAFGHDVDTVHLRIDGSFGRGVLHGLDDYTETLDAGGGWLKTTARKGNMRITATPSSIRIKGSLAVLLSGTNAAPFDHTAVLPVLRRALRDFERVVMSVGGTICDGLLSAAVTRLDFGINVALGKEVGDVERVVSAMTAGRPARLVPHRPHSAEVVLTTRRLAVYDKRRERGRRPVDEAYGDGPVARVELRLVKDVARQLGRPSLTLRDLLDPGLFAELGRRLVEEVDGTPFRRTVRFPDVQTPTALRDACAALGVETAGGPDAVRAAVDAERASGRLGEGKRGTDRASALRREVDRIWTHTGVAVEADVGAAFRSAVRRAVLGGDAT